MSAIAEWVVRVAVPTMLRRRGLLEEADALAEFGPGEHATTLGCLLAARDPAYRKVAAALSLAASVANGWDGEALARHVADMTGCVWSAGGAA